MLAIVPAAGEASRLQPLAGSKELLPLGWSHGRLRVVADYLLERMAVAGADRICLVISPDKPDLLRYVARSAFANRIFFLLQPRAAGLCDAVFRAAAFVQPDEPVLIGLPDTVWLPQDAYALGLRPNVHLITFPVEHPEDFDAVIPAAGSDSIAAQVEVKQAGDPLRRVWGAITMPGRDYLALRDLWRERGERDQFLGHLLNAWMASGRSVTFDRNGTAYWDIGTPAGYACALADCVWDLSGSARALKAA